MTGRSAHRQHLCGPRYLRPTLGAQFGKIQVVIITPFKPNSLNDRKVEGTEKIGFLFWLGNDSLIRVFPKIGVGPQNGWFIMENPI